ncbi:MAG TPA: nucleotidyltransferase [Actinobacteria bacterium]|nr:nucleotidyltransferase [Actinomycetota bacterium]
MGKLVIPEEQIDRFCRQYHIRKLSLFGSALRQELRPDSDIDFLVEFDPEHIPGLLALARMERELSVIWGGRKVDLRTPEDLSRYFRRQVMETAKVTYAI